MKTLKKIFILSIILSIFINVGLFTSNVYGSTSLNFNNYQYIASSSSNKVSTTSESDLTIYSEGAILMEASSGTILYGKNENEKLYPASTTKILTAILAIENCDLSDKITASYEAVMSIPAGYSNAAIQPGETLTMQELLDMFLIHSANEIGFIFAEHISGSVEDFATLMNQKAQSLGCKNTHFTNPSGIHDTEHYSTAYDMALIAQYCMKNEIFRETVSKPSCSISATDKYEQRYFKNTNDLLNSYSEYYYKYATGIKTGYTSQAKRCLIASSLKDNLELIVVTLGAESSDVDYRYKDSINLFEYGYSNYKKQEIAKEGEIIQNIKIKNATKDTQDLSLVIKNDLEGIIPSDLELSDLNTSIELNDLIEAPIKKGDTMGTITYTADKFSYSIDLIADHDVEKFEISTVLWQIILSVVVLLVLSKLIFGKKKVSRKKTSNYSNKSKKKNRKKYNTKKNYDSIYKF